MQTLRTVAQIQSEYADLHKSFQSKTVGWDHYIAQKTKLIEEIGNRGMINAKLSPNHPATLFSGNRVPADSLEDFANRYRRSDRFHMRDEDYRAAIMQTHRNELSEYGITWVAGNDSANGNLVAWSPNAEVTQ
jgi:hypothetical protein